MSQLSKAVFGAIAVSLTLGAAQLASGHDLTVGLQVPTATPETVTNTATVTNRSAKADRAAGTAGSAEQTQHHLAAVAEPYRYHGAGADAGRRKPEGGGSQWPCRAPRFFANPATASPPVGCEAMFSVLSEAAKRLQPGRCVT